MDWGRRSRWCPLVIRLPPLLAMAATLTGRDALTDHCCSSNTFRSANLERQ